MQSIVLLGLPVPGLDNTTTTIAACFQPDLVTPVDTTGWTLVPYGSDPLAQGQYIIDIPLAPDGSTYKIYETANPANWFIGVLHPATLSTLPAEIPPSYLFTFTCGHVIRMALGQLRALKPGEPVPPEEMEDLIMTLNAMLETWATEGFLLYSLTEETRALVAGDKDISIGIGGDWDTTRPLRINKNSFIRNANGYDTRIIPFTKDEYNAISVKSTSNGIPSNLFYEPSYPLGMIYLYYPPAAGYTLHIFSEKPFVSFSDEYTPYSFPTGYALCMALNLAILMAGPYNKALSPSTVALAESMKRTLKAINASANPIMRDFSNVPLGGGSYSDARDAFLSGR